MATSADARAVKSLNNSEGRKRFVVRLLLLLLVFTASVSNNPEPFVCKGRELLKNLSYNSIKRVIDEFIHSDKLGCSCTELNTC